MVWRTIRRTSRRVSAAIQKRAISAASLAFAAASLARTEAALASDSICEAKRTAKGAPRRGTVSVSSVIGVYGFIVTNVCVALSLSALGVLRCDVGLVGVCGLEGARGKQ